MTLIAHCAQIPSPFCKHPPLLLALRLSLGMLIPYPFYDWPDLQPSHSIDHYRLCPNDHLPPSPIHKWILNLLKISEADLCRNLNSTGKNYHFCAPGWYQLWKNKADNLLNNSINFLFILKKSHKFHSFFVYCFFNQLFL